MGRRPLGAALHSPDERSELSQWPGHDDSTVNIIVVIIIIIIINIFMRFRCTYYTVTKHALQVGSDTTTTAVLCQDNAAKSPPEYYHSGLFSEARIMELAGTTRAVRRTQLMSHRHHQRINTSFLHATAPSGLRGYKNWPAPFPGRMSYKATKPGLALSVVYLSMFYCNVVS